MASEPATEPRARLFVALDLPRQTREAVVAWRDAALAGRPELRLLPAESLHLTLAFIGYRHQADVEDIASAALGAVAGLGAAALRPRGIAGVPPRRPRLFALDLDDDGGGAAAIQAAVSRALEEGGWYEPEARPFWPHVTLARVRRDQRTGPLRAAPPNEVFVASEVTLYRSHLSPRGAAYEALASVRLG